jgi:hypothetical protein
VFNDNAGILAPGTVANIKATCPSGSVLVSGGFNGGSPMDQLQLQSSFGDNINGTQPDAWIVVVSNSADNPPVQGPEVEAICAEVSG